MRIAAAVVGVLLVVQGGAPSVIPPYDRAAFGAGWRDADRDCQDTRAEVLIRDARGPITFRTARECVVDRGRWIDGYTGAALTRARAIDIDHRVPLRAAWDAGAWGWSRARRVAFANDLDADDHLVVTAARVNRAKGARGPAAWLPPRAAVDAAAACRYARRWLAVITAWDLWSAPADVAALATALAACPGGA